MKKITSLVLVLVLLFGLCACGNAPITNESAGTQSTTEQTTGSTETPTVGSTEAPTTEPTETPTTEPTEAPTTEPTETPTTEPTEAPTTEPTEAPTTEPTEAPTTEPTEVPTTAPTEPPHTHDFSAATCTEPKTCACGATDGTALGHNWKDATCSAPKTCTTCNATEGKALEHNWTDATCSAPKTCSTCKLTEGAPLSHDFYAGECKNCAEPDSSMTRYYSKDKLFSFVLPNFWNSNTHGINDMILPENRHALHVMSTIYTTYDIMLPVFVFHVVEKNSEFTGFYDGSSECVLITSNDTYDVYMETVLASYISDSAYQDFHSSMATNEDWEELKAVVALKQEIQDSFRWE